MSCTARQDRQKVRTKKNPKRYRTEQNLQQTGCQVYGRENVKDVLMLNSNCLEIGSEGYPAFSKPQKVHERSGHGYCAHVLSVTRIPGFFLSVLQKGATSSHMLEPVDW